MFDFYQTYVLVARSVVILDLELDLEIDLVLDLELDLGLNPGLASLRDLQYPCLSEDEYAHFAKLHFAKLESAIQESAKQYFAKPRNC